MEVVLDTVATVSSSCGAFLEFFSKAESFRCVLLNCSSDCRDQFVRILRNLDRIHVDGQFTDLFVTNQDGFVQSGGVRAVSTVHGYHFVQVVFVPASQGTGFLREGLPIPPA